MKAACWELPSHCRERITLSWMAIMAGKAPGFAVSSVCDGREPECNRTPEMLAPCWHCELLCGFGHGTELLSASSPVKWWLSPNDLWFLLSFRWSNFRIGIRRLKRRHSIFVSGSPSHVSTPAGHLHSSAHCACSIIVSSYILTDAESKTLKRSHLAKDSQNVSS